MMIGRNVDGRDLWEKGLGKKFMELFEKLG